MCNNGNHQGNGNGNGNGFNHGHETLKVSIVYEGHPQAIDDAIYGATRETEWAKAELDAADALIDDLERVNVALVLDLTAMTMTAQDLACEVAEGRKTLAESRKLHAEIESGIRRELDLALEREIAERNKKWDAEDEVVRARRFAEDTRKKLQGEIDARNSTIEKLKAALGAMSEGKITADDVLAFMAARSAEENANFDVNKPVSRYYEWLDEWVDERKGSFKRLDEEPNYPFAVLKGSKENVKAQVLACFIDDPEHKNKIRAIKTLRERSGLGLKESKDLVEWAIGHSYTDR